MLTRRIIPCLDVRAGRVVKGVGFKDLRDAGDPLDMAERYMATGADELCFLDVTASIEDRPLLVDLVRRLSRVLFIPITVGGGVRDVDSARELLRAGADKVGVNTAAVARPELLSELAAAFGSQCVVLSIDAVRDGPLVFVTTHGGREKTPVQVLDWARLAVDRGAGEILLNSINADGTLDGFDLELTREIAAAVPVPVIASGGAGRIDDFITVFRETGAQAALAASVFHDRSCTPRDIKLALAAAGIEVRL